jgi:hypothetical protein
VVTAKIINPVLIPGKYKNCFAINQLVIPIQKIGDIAPLRGNQIIPSKPEAQTVPNGAANAFVPTACFCPKM